MITSTGRTRRKGRRWILNKTKKKEKKNKKKKKKKKKNKKKKKSKKNKEEEIVLRWGSLPKGIALLGP